MTDQQPKALRLAELLESCSLHVGDSEQAEAAAELRRLHRVELARNEWITKTEWVQQAAHPRELGMHRADVMRKRIERLQAENEQLRSALAEATLQHDTAQSTEADPTVGASRLRGVNMSEQNTHAQGCWDWGPKHYECAVGQVKRDEALLRQALSALECSDWYMGQLELIVYSPDDTGTHYVRAKVQSTIAALREQLGASATGAGQAEIEALQETLATLKAENEKLREALKGADNELDWLDEEVGTCDHSVWVCVCSYWGMRRKMKAALAKEKDNEH